MIDGRKSGVAGFTIVETLIVLAVTGLLFVMIAVTFSGRQAKSAFSTAIQDTKTRVQQTASEVTNGFFPDKGTFTCTSPAPNNISIGAGSAAQGTNSACVFLGKIIQFTEGSSDYTVHTVAGYRAQVYTSLSSMDPTIVSAISQTNQLKNGLTFDRMAYNGTRINPSVGFLYSLGQADADGNYATGSQHLDVYRVTNASYTGNPNMTATKLTTGTLQLCFKSGGTDQYGLMTIGGTKGTTSTDLQLTTAADCNLP